MGEAQFPPARYTPDMTLSTAPSRDRRPDIAIAVAACLWGAWWIPLRLLDERGWGGDWSGTAFCLAGTLALLPGAVIHRRRIATAGSALAVCGLLAGLAFAAFNHALVEGEIVRAVLLFYLSPIWATLLAVTVLGARFRVSRALAIAAGLAGAAVVLGADGALPLPRSLADWLGLIAGVAWAGALTSARHIAAVPTFDKAFAATAGAAGFSLAFGLLLTPDAAPASAALASALPLIAAASLLWLIPMTLMEFWGASRLDPGRVCVILMIEIAVAAGSAAVLTDEAFGWREAVGTLLILAAGLIDIYGPTGSGPRPGSPMDKAEPAS
ncbi:MAG: DMT family transporter [Rhodospirillaceae bacterium]|nr:DMT family transporter [Rhodospirillaceae bacterium]